MNPTYHFARMRELLAEYQPSRELSLAATKLDECELWLSRSRPASEALGRDMAAPVGDRPEVACPACGRRCPAEDGKLIVHVAGDGIGSVCPGSGVTIKGEHQ